MELSTEIPQPIIALIMAADRKALLEKDVAEMLPPMEIREMIVSEQKAGSGTLDVAAAAVDWLDNQRVLIERMEKAKEGLNEVEPWTREQAIQGNIPVWAGEKWAEILQYPWSHLLENAIAKAELYIDSKCQK
jgi:hypothetical protein